MDLKTVELEILKINEEFIDYLDKLNLESDEKAEAIIRDLSLKVDEKSVFLKSLESKLIETDEEIKSKINNLLDKLDNLIRSEKKLKYNIDEVLVELEKQKQEELKPFLLNHKKKKTEIAHKITAQKKELGFLHKENNNKLIEEEKNFKNREIELTRRMGIDLDRLNESNVKKYSDIEKSILDMEDVKLIKETQKKINSIRLVGIKENLSIKNKYSLQNYENRLDFKRFQEKIKLDNAILTEEFKQRVKMLEYEKEQLEDEEALKIALKDFEIELKIKEFERENELDQLEFEKEKLSNKHSINEEVILHSNEASKVNYEYLEKINSEISSFDKIQLTEFIMTDNFIFSSDRKVVDCLIQSLRNYVISFKEILLICADDYISKRTSIIENLVYLLSSSKFEKFYSGNLSYEDFVDKFGVIVDEYLKALNASFSRFTRLVKSMIKSFEDELNLSLSLLKEHFHESEVIHNVFFNKFTKFLDDEFKNKDLILKNVYDSNNKKTITLSETKKDEYNKQLSNIKDKTKKVINEYNIKKKEILSKIDAYKNNLKLKQDKDKKELNKYIKQSKVKINNFKKVYSENISNYEKVEHNEYKESMKQNRVEYKNRLESIEK